MFAFFFFWDVGIFQAGNSIYNFPSQITNDKRIMNKSRQVVGERGWECLLIWVIQITRGNVRNIMLELHTMKKERG